LHILAILGALAILTIAGALCFALWQAWRIKLRHRRVLEGKVPSLEELGVEGARLYQSEAALFHGTRFADGSKLLDVGLSSPCVGDLWCGERALFLKREPGAPGLERTPVLAWPLKSIGEASLRRGFAPLAGKELPLLHLRWMRGGELLVSELSLRGGMEQLERLRREIHLRQDGGKALVQLGKLGPPPPVA
jgi:hypothetical protein